MSGILDMVGKLGFENILVVIFLAPKCIIERTHLVLLYVEPLAELLIWHHLKTSK